MADILKGGTAVVIGAASALGEATSLHFVRDGCRKLVLGDIAEQPLADLRTRILSQYTDTEIVIARVDVGNEDEVNAFFESSVQKFGRVDFAVNISNAEHRGALSIDAPSEDFQSAYDNILRPTFLCERVELLQMSKQELLKGYQCRGSIVNVTSLCSTIAFPGLTAYSGTQGGILGMSKTDAFDFGPHGIRVNCVAHGNLITSMLDSAMGEEEQQTWAAKTALRRLGRAEDVANAVVWLSSPRAGYITGISLPVDGGFAIATGPP